MAAIAHMNGEPKTALVTGGAKRVGAAIARALAHAGYDLIIHYNASQAEAEKTAADVRALGRKASLIQADFGSTEQVVRMLDTLDAEYPPVQVLVNAASVYYKTQLTSLKPHQWDQNLDVNLRAPFLLAQRLGLDMKRRGAGKIINISDSATRRPYRGFLPYLVSKSALNALTQVLALELAPEVQVNAIAPGTVLLPENASDALKAGIIRRTPLGIIGLPEDIAELVLFLVQKGTFITGGVYPVDGGSGIAP